MSAEFSVYDPETWEILRNGECPDDEVSSQGEHVVEGRFDPAEAYVMPGGLVQYYSAEQAAAKASPRYGARWSNASMSWIDLRDLAMAKSQQVEAMRQAREAVINGGFVWDGSGFDSDQLAQLRLLGVVMAAQVPGFEPVDWRLTDNTWRTLDAAAVAGVWGALQMHIRDAFARFGELEGEINAATTPEAVAAVEW